MTDTLKKILITALLILAAVISALPLADMLSSDEANAQITASIDDKIGTVLKLTSSSALVSTGISAIPGDTATPIAEKLADFSQYFLFILCVLYTEKFFLSIIGTAVFRVLIPCACLFAIIGIYRMPRLMHRLSAKLFIFAIALYIVIPLSVKVSDRVYDSFDAAIGSTLTSADQFTDDTAEFIEADNDATIIESLMDKLSETTTGLATKAANVLNRFIETIAVLIVTSCVIPLLGLAFFVWVVKLLTGLDLFKYMPRASKMPKFRSDGRETVGAGVDD